MTKEVLTYHYIQTHLKEVPFQNHLLKIAFAHQQWKENFQQKKIATYLKTHLIENFSIFVSYSTYVIYTIHFNNIKNKSSCYTMRTPFQMSSNLDTNFL